MIGQAIKRSPGPVTVTWGDIELPANAAGLIVVLDACTLHAMTKKESEQLHELIDCLRIDIENAWALWDS